MRQLLGMLDIEFLEQARVAGMAVDFLLDGGVAVFIDSPYWHLRDASTLNRLPPYWQGRLRANRRRDQRQNVALRRLGYSVVRVWADDVARPSTISRIRRILSLRKSTNSAPK